MLIMFDVEVRSKGLLVFHSVTGFDTTKGMLDITKRTAFKKRLDIVAKDSSILAAMNNLTSHDLTAINRDDNQQKGVIERFMSRIHHADCCNCFFSQKLSYLHQVQRYDVGQ